MWKRRTILPQRLDVAAFVDQADDTDRVVDLVDDLLPLLSFALVVVLGRLLDDVEHFDDVAGPDQFEALLVFARVLHTQVPQLNLPHLAAVRQGPRLRQGGKTAGRVAHAVEIEVHQSLVVLEGTRLRKDPEGLRTVPHRKRRADLVDHCPKFRHKEDLKPSLEVLVALVGHEDVVLQDLRNGRIVRHILQALELRLRVLGTVVGMLERVRRRHLPLVDHALPAHLADELEGFAIVEREHEQTHEVDLAQGVALGLDPPHVGTIARRLGRVGLGPDGKALEALARFVLAPDAILDFAHGEAVAPQLAGRRLRGVVTIAVALDPVQDQGVAVVVPMRNFHRERRDELVALLGFLDDVPAQILAALKPAVAVLRRQVDLAGFGVDVADCLLLPLKAEVEVDVDDDPHFGKLPEGAELRDVTGCGGRHGFLLWLPVWDECRCTICFARLYSQIESSIQTTILIYERPPISMPACTIAFSSSHGIADSFTSRLCAPPFKRELVMGSKYQ